MVLTKIAKRNPRDIAQAIVDNLDASKAHVKQIDIAGPGFINFYLNNQYLTDIIPEESKKDINLGMQKHLKTKIFYLNMYQPTQLVIYISVMHEMRLLVTR